MAAEHGIEITAAESRRNVLTRGIDLNALVGKRFRVGDVECVGVELCEPCKHLESADEAGRDQGPRAPRRPERGHRHGRRDRRRRRGRRDGLRWTQPVRVACAQVEPVAFDRAATLDKLASVAARGSRHRARSSFSSPRRSSRSTRRAAGRASSSAAGTASRPSRGSRASRSRSRAPTPTGSARSRASIGIHLAVGVNERDGGTLYNSLLVFAPGRRARAAPPQAVPDEPRAARLGTRRRQRPRGDPDRRRPRRRAHLLGEPHAARARRALRVAASRSTSRRRPTTPRSGTTRSATSRASHARSSSRAASSSARRAIRTTSRSREGDELLGRGGSAIVARTASTSPARSGTRRGSSSPTSIPIFCTRSGSASTRRATTRGPTCCG